MFLRDLFGNICENIKIAKINTRKHNSLTQIIIWTWAKMQILIPTNMVLFQKRKHKSLQSLKNLRYTVLTIESSKAGTNM